MVPISAPSGIHPSESHGTSATMEMVPRRSIQKKKLNVYLSRQAQLSKNSAEKRNKTTHNVTFTAGSTESGADAMATQSVRKRARSKATRNRACAKVDSMARTTRRRNRAGRMEFQLFVEYSSPSSSSRANTASFPPSALVIGTAPRLSREADSERGRAGGRLEPIRDSRGFLGESDVKVKLLTALDLTLLTSSKETAAVAALSLMT